jgi:hypothetical protein
MKFPQQVRTELLIALTELGSLRPEWRLAQTLANIATTAGRVDAGAVWDLEDEEALTAARTLIRQCFDNEAVAVGRNAAPQNSDSQCQLPCLPQSRSDADRANHRG